MIIGFTGSMGAGKSTAIEYVSSDIFERHRADRKVTLVKFAKALYDIQEYIYNRISDVYQRPDTFIKDRKLLQWIGTDWARGTISETLWVDIWKNSVNRSLSHDPSTVIVCDDVRFDNEAEAVKALGGYVVKIFCSSNEKRIDTSTGIVQHKSEAGIDHKYVDYFIDNNGSLEDLARQVENLVAELNEREKSKNGI